MRLAIYAFIPVKLWNEPVKQGKVWMVESDHDPPQARTEAAAASRIAVVESLILRCELIGCD
jgi:hypothetical protein